MNIVVCLKRVPDTTEADLVIERDRQSIREGNLVYILNEWDGYALEEAIRLKEAHGGTVTALTLGEEDSQEVLRRALAMGADEAVHLKDPAFRGSDGWALTRILARYLKSHPFDLILTGVMASDVMEAQVGPMLAQILGIPHATLVTKLEVREKDLKVWRELEGGWEETLRISLPCLLSIQTGINEPRYVSITGIRKVRGRAIGEKTAADLGLAQDQIGPAGSLSSLVHLDYPPEGEGAELIGGSSKEIAGRLYQVLREKGGVA
jgi:electron transfer flavoprotein beta subunit